MGLISWADVARHSLFVLKVSLNTNQSINQTAEWAERSSAE